MPRAALSQLRNNLLASRSELVSQRVSLIQIQNLSQRSNEFDHSYWTKDQVVPTPNALANPIDGLVNAYLFADNATVGNHRMYGGLLTMNRNTPYCYSIFVKDNDRRYFSLTEDSASGFACVLDLQTGSITSTFYDTSKYISVTFDAKPVNNQPGWYQVWAVFIPKTNTNVFVAFSLSNTNLVSGLIYGGTGKSVYIYQAQEVRANWPGPFCLATNATVNPNGKLRDLVL